MSGDVAEEDVSIGHRLRNRLELTRTEMDCISRSDIIYASWLATSKSAVLKYIGRIQIHPKVELGSRRGLFLLFQTKFLPAWHRPRLEDDGVDVMIRVRLTMLRRASPQSGNSFADHLPVVAWKPNARMH